FSASDGLVRFFQLGGAGPSERESLKAGAGGEVSSFAFAPDNRRVVACNGSGTVVVWASDTREKLNDWQLPGAVRKVVFAADGQHIATLNGNGTIYVLRLAPPPSIATKPALATTTDDPKKVIDARRPPSGQPVPPVT